MSIFLSFYQLIERVIGKLIITITNLQTNNYYSIFIKTSNIPTIIMSNNIITFLALKTWGIFKITRE